jgi:two-component system response regulator HupR/HoxA
MASSLPVVLIVDDEPRSVEALRRTLEDEFLVLTATGSDEARAIMASEFVQIVLCDQRMPGTSGIEFLKQVRLLWPEAVRIVLSGYTDSQDIIAAINEAGIWQYLLKPWSPEQLLLTLRSAAEAWSLQRENQRLAVELRQSPQTLRERTAERRRVAQSTAGFDRLTRAPGSPLDAICLSARNLARHDLSVLITGETGTGKELLARAMHYASPRSDGPFIMENCGALPDSLLESELFGYKRGAFTGAYEDRVGLLAQADGGTIFLDEVGDTSPALQSKLLRALQEREVRPLGAARSVRINVRVIAATNRDLQEDVRQGRFREDFYYRLVGATLHLPPLRARGRDLTAIAHEILQREAPQFGLPQARLSVRALEFIQAYPWPGNVRELQNELRQMLALAAGDELGPELLSPRVVQAPRGESEARDLATLAGLDGTLRERMEQLEARVIKEVLVHHRWNKSRAAAELGLSRVGLRSKLARYGMDKNP